MSWAPIILVAAGCSLRASAQPGFCASDHHCQSGFYCVPDVFLCQRCLDCEDLKRDPPSAPTACIRSVAECGSCIKGLVNDLSGDVTAECVTPPAAALPTWAWALVSLGLLLFVLVVGAVLYVLRHTNTFKILASTRTSVRSPDVVASAPDAPPPYRAHYHHHNEHRNHHNDHDHDHDTDHYDTDTEHVGRDHADLLPDLVDPSAPSDDGSPPASPRARKPRPPPRGPREASARQETRYFNQPYYVRPPTYSDAGVSSPASPAPEPPSLHDEDTMESTWTAAPHDNNGNASGGCELAELLAAARLNDQRLNHHHNHHHPYTQDSNNNRSSGAAPGDADPSGSAQSGPAPRTLPHTPVSYFINVVQNMQSRTYSDAGVSSPASPAPEPPSLHDEDTMESTWTAAPHDNNGNASGGCELAELLAAARLNDQRLNHHHNHHHPYTQDSNNNRSSGAAPGEADPSGSAQSGPAPRTLPHTPVSYFINVVQNMQSRT